jgi:hypothetical protein
MDDIGHKFLDRLALDPRMILEECDRRVVVRLAGSALVNAHGLWPSSELKEAMADAIVEAFPSTAVTDADCRPSCNFYSRKHGNGFLDMRIKDIRKSRKELKNPKQSEKPKERPSKKQKMKMPSYVSDELEAILFKVP